MSIKEENTIDVSLEAAVFISCKMQPFVLILCIVLLISSRESKGYIVFPDSWRINSPVNSPLCNVLITSSVTNMTLDQHCAIEKTLFGTDFHSSYYKFLENERNNCHKQAFFKVSMTARYTVITKNLLATGHKLYDNKRFEVSLGDKSLLNISVPIEISTFNDRTLEMFHPYYNWTTTYSIFQRFPVSDDPPAVLSIRNVHNSTYYSLDGYLEITDWKVEYVPHPDKWDFASQPIPRVVASDNDPLDTCSLLGSSHALILNKIIVDSSASVVGESGRLDVEKLPRVFCAIYTIQKYHDNVIAMRDTWGRKCTSFLAFSDVTDPTIPSLYLPHQGVETYWNIWQKVRSMLQYVYHHYRDEYDYFLFGGDDMYYVMENLYAYLNSDEIRAARARGEGLYLGREYYQDFVKVRYNTGGPGYLLDSTTLKIFGTNMERCNPDYVSSMEDVTVGFCLDGIQKIHPYNTADSHGRQRWHNFPPGYLLFPDTSDNVRRQEMEKCDIHLKFGDECCSPSSVAFHYVRKEQMYEIENYLYSCANDIKNYFYELMGPDYYDNSTVLHVLHKEQ